MVLSVSISPSRASTRWIHFFKSVSQMVKLVLLIKLIFYFTLTIHLNDMIDMLFSKTFWFPTFSNPSEASPELRFFLKTITYSIPKKMFAGRPITASNQFLSLIFIRPSAAPLTPLLQPLYHCHPSDSYQQHNHRVYHISVSKLGQTYHRKGWIRRLLGCP